MPPIYFLEESDRGVANTGVPLAGQVMSVIISLATVHVLTLFLGKSHSHYFSGKHDCLLTEDAAQRSLAIRAWSRLPFVVWCLCSSATCSVSRMAVTVFSGLYDICRLVRICLRNRHPSTLLRRQLEFCYLRGGNLAMLGVLRDYDGEHGRFRELECERGV